ncbi:hypothetical protein [Candidatus Nitrosacidococcus sp. I8]|uniref:hypothetical protein n=1 Tax=Candidatus Nitrosacidococcus sp. I8 TaxID=2942908 RepID=UPI00222680E4|nr:hypothetical protein [Candidatus Nitrosacidococcus sp. I8]CAH9018136.1 hypothetical protein NURINAE_00749 [Candidatus Nitrosacidococcus sp. I8]
MPRLIVIKDKPNHDPDQGRVIPIFVEEEDKSLRLPKSDDFRHGNKIFVSKGYTEIERRYKDSELFTLTDYKENENDRDKWKEHLNQQQFYALGSWSDPIKSNTYIPIISGEIPNLNTGEINFSDSQAKEFLIHSNVKYFFILNREKVSGPFSLISNSELDRVEPLIISANPLGLKPHYIAHFKSADLKNHTINSTVLDRSFLISLKEIKNSKVDFQEQDYISDENLISYFKKNKFGTEIPNDGKYSIKGLLDFIKTNHDKIKTQEESPERIKRLEKILEQFIRESGNDKEIIRAFFKTAEGEKYLENYVESHSQVLPEHIREELNKKKRIQKEDLNKEYEKEKQILENDLIKIKDEIEQQKAEREKTKTEKEEALKQDHQKLLRENETLKKENEELKSENQEIRNICNLQTEKNKLAGVIEHLEGSKTKLEGEVKNIKEDIRINKRFFQDPKQIKEAILEHHALVRILNGIPSDTDTVIKPIELKKSQKSLNAEDTNSKMEFIKNLQERFNHSNIPGRSFSYDEITNLLLCVIQSFLTIFAGPPGMGKTSSTLRLADSLYLNDTESSDKASAFLSISVGRGWTANRDLLGFYNTLKNVYQPARTGFYQFLKSTKLLEESFLNLVLLDEGNLSSMEYYWSDFLGRCDQGEKKTSLDTGMPDEKERFLKIPAGLRFIATINNDETTERISPRLIDRAPIILLNNSDSQAISESITDGFNGAVTYQELKAAFCPEIPEDTELDSDNELNEIIHLLKEASIFVSPRKKNAIRQYCYVAQNLNYQQYELDYAISQHILPLIHGYGSHLQDTLKKIEETLDKFSFSISRNILRTIIKNGDEFAQTYSFF